MAVIQRNAPNEDLNDLVTLQISLVCEMTDERSRAEARELLKAMAEEFALRCLLLSTRMPIGETMMRFGLAEPERRKVEPGVEAK